MLNMFWESIEVCKDNSLFKYYRRELKNQLQPKILLGRNARTTSKSKLTSGRFGVSYSNDNWQKTIGITFLLNLRRAVYGILSQKWN